MSIEIVVAKKQALELLSNTSENPLIDINYLIAEYADINLSQVALIANEKFTTKQEKAFFQAVARLNDGEPLAYIIGHWGFWEYDFLVNNNVLIPRQDTETMIEAILDQFNNELPLRVLELGTGSGIIALVIAKARPNWQIVAVDICSQALSVAKKNQQKLRVDNVNFIQSDWYQNLNQGEFYNLIISNPPYLATNDKHLKALKFEPVQALVAGETGLDALESVIKGANDRLYPGGYLFLESGADQIADISKLMACNHVQYLEAIEDINGKPRVSIGRVGFTD